MSSSAGYGAVAAVDRKCPLEFQKQADAAVEKLEAERVKLQSTQAILQANNVQAFYDAVRYRTAN